MIYGRYFDLPRAEIRERAAELLEFVQLSDRRDSRVDPLSGGMKRRLTIAAFADQPARAAAARRADDRPRPAGAPPPLGPALPAEAQRRDARAHDALHGRGRAALRPPRDHGQRAASSPRDRRAQLIADNVTREVVEVRLPIDADVAAEAARLEAVRRAASSRSPIACSSTPTTATRPRSAVAADGFGADVGARAPGEPRRRVPDPHRPHARGLTRRVDAAAAPRRRTRGARATRGCGAGSRSARSCSPRCTSGRWASGSAGSSTRTPGRSTGSTTSTSSRPVCSSRARCSSRRRSRCGRCSAA